MQREGTSTTERATANQQGAIPEPSAAKGDQKAPAKPAVSLSPKAIEAAKKQLAKRGTPDAALRLGLKGGGCSGFSYVIEFSDDPPRERDRVFDFDGVKVFVDPKSLIYL